MGKKIAWVALAMLSLAGMAKADKIANPQYDAWSKFKVGAFSKVDVDTTAAGTTSKSTTTTKLTALSADKLTLEVTTSMTAMGQKMDMPPQTIEVPAQIEKPADAAAAEPKKGDETIKAAGKDIKTSWTETRSEQGGTTVLAKSWTSPEIPGGVVKMTSSSTGAMASTMTMVLVEFADGK